MDAPVIQVSSLEGDSISTASPSSSINTIAGPGQPAPTRGHDVIPGSTPTPDGLSPTSGLLGSPSSSPLSRRSSVYSEATAVDGAGADGLTTRGNSPECERGNYTGEPLNDEPISISDQGDGSICTVYLSPAPYDFMSKQRYTREPMEAYDAAKNYFTNEWLYDDEKHKLIETTLGLFEDQVRTEELDPKDWEICLSIWVDKDTKNAWMLLHLRHGEEGGLYIHEVDQSFFTESLDEVEILGREHLGVAAHRGYWEHLFMFPHGRVIQKEMLESFSLNSHRETSKSSTAPYDASDLARFLNIMKGIECDDNQHSHLNMLRHMSTIHIERTMRYYASVLRPSKYVNYVQSCDVFLLLTPEIYLERLNKVWVNHMVNSQYWRKFIEDTQADWQGSITPTTVILAAISASLPFKVSIKMNADNIVVPDDVLAPRAMTPRGVEMLAIMFSIPTAFFLWGLVTFFIAISWLCFWDTARSVWIVIVSFVSVFALLIALVLRNSKRFLDAAAATRTDAARKMRTLTMDALKRTKSVGSAGSVALQRPILAATRRFTSRATMSPPRTPTPDSGAGPSRSDGGSSPHSHSFRRNSSLRWAQLPLDTQQMIPLSTRTTPVEPPAIQLTPPWPIREEEDAPRRPLLTGHDMLLLAAPYDSDATSFYTSISTGDNFWTERGTVALRRSDGTQWAVEELIAFERDVIVDSGLRCTLALVKTALPLPSTMSSLRATVVEFAPVADPMMKTKVALDTTVHGKCHKRIISNDKRAMVKLWKEADRTIKAILTANQETQATDSKGKSSRSEFEAACKDLNNRFAIAKPLFISGRITGRAATTPMVEAVFSEFSLIKIAFNVNADEAAVLGAAYNGIPMRTFVQFPITTDKLVYRSKRRPVLELDKDAFTVAVSGAGEAPSHACPPLLAS
ncbi:uncharacterized protein BXZ73DRAFT_98017 [Epithele typhae]|uniref:uncharacterized protein n=1 Tax=Epithele typhae TaxID=378194 RepID=UPI002007897B|nr:uncharacterized protein BXZ73DRAFT_98017 [Epithele typhae]KAH9941628.1 hypothetical protein BXZ73DRAFT_98017 [Epithele typhae]